MVTISISIAARLSGRFALNSGSLKLQVLLRRRDRLERGSQTRLRQMKYAILLSIARKSMGEVIVTRRTRRGILSVHLDHSKV